MRDTIRNRMCARMRVQSESLVPRRRDSGVRALKQYSQGSSLGNRLTEISLAVLSSISNAILDISVEAPHLDAGARAAHGPRHDRHPHCTPPAPLAWACEAHGLRGAATTPHAFV
eukprot:1841791-Prymnesium_polylepis.1